MVATCISIALGLFFLWLAALNWVALVRRLSSESRTSWVPVIGGIAGAAAALLEPTGELRPFWWAAFILDAGSLPGLVSTVVILVFRPARDDA
jgi:hypothetical protein